jgi:hypothetical protein
MKDTISSSVLLALLLSPIASFGQDAPKPSPSATSNAPAPSGEISKRSTQASLDPPSPITPSASQRGATGGTDLGPANKLDYYFSETFLNLGMLTAPAFRASLRMANPPGKGATQYPNDWRQGAGAFGRNYGDAYAERISNHTARFLTGVMTREDPRYIPSSSRNVLARSFHALSFTFIDHSDSGHPMPAISNFVGAAAGGFVGDAYLPAGFNNVTHAGQRATINFGMLGAGNLFREFAPQMPRPMRTFYMLIAR